MSGPTPAQAKRTVAGCVALSGLIVFVDRVSDADVPAMRVVIGGFLAAGLLSILAEPAPKAATGLAWMLLIGALLGAGEKPIIRIAEMLGGKR